MSFIRYGVVVISFCVLIFLFLHKSHVPEVWERYSQNYFNLLCFATVNVAILSITFIKKERWQILYKRVTIYPVIPSIIILMGVFVIMDGLWDIMTLNPLTPLLFFATSIFALLGSRDPQKILEKIALVTMATIGSLFVVEIFFPLLLHSKIPEDQKSFYREISSSWPQKIAKDKAKDTLRILGLCDSFGRAGGHENYHYLLQKYLEEDGRKVEVINFSAGGYEPLHQLHVLKKFAAQYQPDVVVHGFFVGNDFANPDTNTSEFAEISVRKRSGIMKFRPHSWVLFQWLRNYYKAQNNIERAGVFKKDTFLAIEYERLQTCRPHSSTKVRWQDTVFVLDQIREYTKSIKAKYIMVIHPDQFQSDKKLQEQLQKKYAVIWRDYHLRLPQNFLMSYCAENDTPCLDLLPYFQKSEDVLYLMQNTHYNHEGNKLAARKIHAFLQELKYLNLGKANGENN